MFNEINEGSNRAEIFMTEAKERGNTLCVKIKMNFNICEV